MVTEGLAEILHAAARGESITCILLNNGVFGDTGGQMTATTTVGQRTKTSLYGRDAGRPRLPDPHRRPRRAASRASPTSPAARSTADAVARTRRYLQEAFESQLAGAGFSLVEILTMCPTGWSVPADQGAEYQRNQMTPTYPLGVLTT